MGGGAGGRGGRVVGEGGELLSETEQARLEYSSNRGPAIHSSPGSPVCCVAATLWT